MKAGIVESKKNVAAPTFEANTFIGGVTDILPTKTALASKLNISESNISFFQIVGDEIQVKINVDYAISINAWRYTNITYYIEKNEGRCISTGTN